MMSQWKFGTCCQGWCLEYFCFVTDVHGLRSVVVKLFLPKGDIMCYKWRKIGLRMKRCQRMIDALRGLRVMGGILYPKSPEPKSSLQSSAAGIISSIFLISLSVLAIKWTEPMTLPKKSLVLSSRCRIDENGYDWNGISFLRHTYYIRVTKRATLPF